jgi:hypothetical protein
MPECSHIWVSDGDSATHCALCGIFIETGDDTEEKDDQPDPPCPMTGSMGIHTEGYYEGYRCEWCGAKKISATA